MELTYKNENFEIFVKIQNIIKNWLQNMESKFRRNYLEG